MSSNEFSDKSGDDYNYEYIDDSRDEYSSDSSNGLKLSRSREKWKWLNSIKKFLQETQADSLDLSHRQLEKNETASVLKVLKNSQITELNLGFNNLKNGMKYLSKLLAPTKLKKLSVSACDLKRKDLVHLMKILKGSEITDLDFSVNFIHFNASLVDKFTSYLLQSNLTKLNIGMNYLSEAATTFTRKLPDSSITHLNLSRVMKENKSCDLITSLASNLQHTVITDLNLSDNSLSLSQLKQLSESLQNSKLKILNLSSNKISDAGVNALTDGLVHSKITNLNLGNNQISGQNNLGQHLRHTLIQTLQLSGNRIQYDEMFNFPDFLSGSSVHTLELHWCTIGDEIGQKLMKSLELTGLKELVVSGNGLKTSSIFEFSKSVKSTNITDVNFSHNDLPVEAVSILGDCLKGSKLKCINLSENFNSLEGDVLVNFIEQTKETSVVSLDLMMTEFKFDDSVVESLKNTTFTHFDLSYCWFGFSGVLSLGAALKFTAVTHLIIQGNDLGDKGTEALAKCLKETLVIELDISNNLITSKGAKALANALKETNLLHVILDENEIGDDGFHCLAEQIRFTFITVLDVDSNRGSRKLLIDAALWENRKIVHRLIASFKKIISEANDTNFQFCRSADCSNINSLLEDYLFLYKTVVERPSAVNVLAQEESFCLSKTQVTTLMLEEFPRQFVMFIGRSIEAEVTQHINLLKRTEELGLENITELLLLNRPAYVVDKNQDILHPYVYRLMYKYKQPIVNSAVEPYGKDKIIEYFTKHEELEGASDIINLLCRSVNDSKLESSKPQIEQASRKMTA